MSALIVATTVLYEDEPCLAISETNQQSPGSRGFHRYRVIKVRRGENVVECRIDMGPMENFKTPAFGAPLMGLHTVGEALEIADRAPDILKFDEDEVRDNHRLEVQAKEKARTHFGPVINIQRS